MIVTAELVRDLGTAKFIPIVRQNVPSPITPTSVSTRRYINLSENADHDSEFQLLLRDLHSIPSEKPRLGRSPFATGSSQAPVANAEPPHQQTVARSGEVVQTPVEYFNSARLIAQAGDMLQWRRLVGNARNSVAAVLNAWRERYLNTHPGEITALIEQSMEGVPAFAPLTAVALGGVASGSKKFSSQVGLLEDVLNPSQWDRSGFVARVELPETGAFVYQALMGSMCLLMGNVRAAISLARYSTVDRQTGSTKPLWSRHNIIAWPESLGKSANSTWRVALGLSSRWTWLREPFSDDNEYQAGLYAYYVTMTLVEFVERVRSGFEIPDDPVKAQWWPDVPAFFEVTDENIRRVGYQLIVSEKEEFRSWISGMGVAEVHLRQLWPKWLTHKSVI
jgi:hypothetical protein